MIILKQCAGVLRRDIEKRSDVPFRMKQHMLAIRLGCSAALLVVLDYSNAIAQKRYDQAYGLWAEGGAASGQTLSEFEQGYANTAGLSVLLDRATVSGDAVTVPITILSVLNQSDQT
jgi:hypothetical protein